MKKEAKTAGVIASPCLLRQESVPLVGRLSNANFAQYKRTRLPMLIMFLDIQNGSSERPLVRVNSRIKTCGDGDSLSVSMMMETAIKST